MNKLIVMTVISACTWANVMADTVYKGSEAYGRIQGTEVLRYEDYTGIPTYIRFRESERPAFANWESWMKDRFFKNVAHHGFELVGQEVDRLGMVHYRYIQKSALYPLAPAAWIVHTINGMVHSMNGELYDEVPLFSPSISESQALEIALDHINASIYKWELPEEEALVKMLEDDVSASYFPSGSLEAIAPLAEMKSKLPVLCWKFNVYAHEPMSRREIYIHANLGDVVFEHDLIHHSDSNGTAVTGYSGQRNIVTDYTGTSFRLRETSRGNGIETYDLNNGTSGLGSDFFHNDNHWDNTGVERFATDAHWGAEMTYDYFYNHFNRNSINNNGFTLRSRVHYGTNYANAFWNGSYMTYGDGSSGNAPFTALDIAGHEIAHGLTSFTAGLIYANESGALNESFSDIFGAAIEFDALGMANGDWLIGEDLGFVIRSMSNPNNNGDPDTYHGNNWYFGTLDNGGVHTNSGVQNHWFYLLTVGGSGTNDIGNAFNIDGIGVAAAGAVAYRNLVVYLSASSDYEDARFYAIQSAMDLYGPCSQELISTANAWYAVGLGTPYETDVTADFIPSSTGNCSVPHSIKFINTSSNATSYSWNFGDGSTSSQFSPNHTYTTAGTYTVSLQVSSSCGSDELVVQELVQVGPGAPCEVTLPSNNQPLSLSTCTGVLIDDGGPTGNYSDNANNVAVITAQGAATISLWFNEFMIEAGGGSNCIYDFIELYDGNSVNAPLIGRYCNSNLPPSSITTTSASVTIRFSSDEGQNFAGFKLAWECNEPTSAPLGDFAADMTSTCDGQVQFTDLTTNGSSAWTWNFGDGNTSNLQHPTHQYASNGNYTVTLMVQNIAGSDTIVKANYIAVNNPESPVTTDDHICPGNQGVLIASGYGTRYWYDGPWSNAPIYSGDTFITPIVQQSTTYYAESVAQSSAKGVGPPSKNIGSGSYIASQQSLYFDAHKDLILHSVKVYSNTAADREFLVIGSSGQAVADTVVWVEQGLQEVILDFEIPAGNDYRLAPGSNNTINLFRNTSGAQYPYQLQGLISITKSSGSQPYTDYHYFYDWQVKELCKSERVAVEASVAECLGEESISRATFHLYPIPASDKVTLTSADDMGVFQLNLLDVHGRKVKAFGNAGPGSTVLYTGDLAGGMYFLELISADGGRLLLKLMVQP